MQPHRRRQLAYAALSIADTWFATKGRQRARLVTKPLLMPALAAVTPPAPKPPPGARRTLPLAGSWVGDIAFEDASDRTLTE
jgi:hypothetical protein